MAEPTIADRLLERDVLVPLLFAGGVVAIVVVRTIAGIVKSVQRERSRREIAAFIAEGSMSPEQGERLMKAGERER